MNMEALEGTVNASNDHWEKLIEYAKENVIFVSGAPHEWFFQQVSLTAHHGGAGTTNGKNLHFCLSLWFACSRIKIGCPHNHHPHVWRPMRSCLSCTEVGSLVGFKQQLQKIDVKDLLKAIETIANNPAIAKRANEIGEQMRNKNGCKAIVEEMEKYWAEEVTTRRFLEDINDWKVATKEMKSRKVKKTLLRSFFC